MVNIPGATDLAGELLGVAAGGATHVRPPDAGALARSLREAIAAGRAVAPWGGGTEQALGSPPRACHVVLHTDALTGVLAYAPEDLTVSVQAGTSLADLGQALARHGQFLPIDVPDPEKATVGGVVATAAVPVRRLRYGAVRDQVIGLEVALPDGSLVKTGGRVVKNVAGYDLCKLFTGSLGTLGVIVSANFKVQPLPRASAVVHAYFAQADAAVGAGAALAATSLGYSALLLEWGPRQALYHLVVIGEGFAGGVRRQTDAAQQRAMSGAATIEIEEDGDAVTQEIARLAAWRATSPVAPGTLLRGAVAPGRTLRVVSLLEQLALETGLAADLQLDLGVGSFFLRLPQAPDLSVESYVLAARLALQPLGGHLVVAAGPATLRRHLDPWAAPASGRALAMAIKDRLDPHGRLNPGRFAFGL